MKLVIFLLSMFFIQSCSSTRPEVKQVVTSKKPISIGMSAVQGWRNIQITTNFKNVAMYKIEVYNNKGKKISTVAKGSILSDGEMVFFWDYYKEKVKRGEYTIKIFAKNFDEAKVSSSIISIGG